MQHELATDQQTHVEPERPTGLAALRPDLSRPFVPVTWDVPTSEMAHQVAALAVQADRVANHVQGMPQRFEHDAVLADIHALQMQVQMLFDAVRENTREIHTLLLKANQRAA